LQVEGESCHDDDVDGKISPERDEHFNGRTESSSPRHSSSLHKIDNPKDNHKMYKCLDYSKRFLSL